MNNKTNIKLFTYISVIRFTEACSLATTHSMVCPVLWSLYKICWNSEKSVEMYWKSYMFRNLIHACLHTSPHFLLHFIFYAINQSVRHEIYLTLHFDHTVSWQQIELHAFVDQNCSLWNLASSSNIHWMYPLYTYLICAEQVSLNKAVIPQALCYLKISLLILQ